MDINQHNQNKRPLFYHLLQKPQVVCDTNTQNTQNPPVPTRNQQCQPKIIPVQTTQSPVQIQPQKSDNNILQDDFFTYIVGPPKSGKSTLLNALLLDEDYYGKYFDFHIFVSPTQISPLQDKNNWLKNVSSFDLFNQIKAIREKISEINDNKSRGQFQKQSFKLAIIFDDVVSQFQEFSQDQFFLSLFLNRRHIIPDCEIDIFVCSQKYNLMPTKFRVNITSSFLFFVSNQEFKTLQNEIIKYNNIKLIQNIMMKECQQKYGFVYIHNCVPIRIFNSQFKEIYLI